ncbi:MAG TPA: hypothetical protein VLG13_03585, partial [Patescibacteria group bacterium]|nr:hypothetical protein [Patescibacteria group bacterium]
MSSSMFTHFALGSPAIHVAPAPDFTIAGIPVTNAMLYGWIVVVALVGFLIYIARKITVHPKAGVVQYVEAGVDFA